MIFLDQDVGGQAIQEALLKWWPGKVEVVPPLADEDLWSWLAGTRGCVFITNNTSDFWNRFNAHPRYCTLCIDVDKAHAETVSEVVRKVLSSPLLNQRRKRNGLIIRANRSGAVWYRRLNDPVNSRLTFATGRTETEPR